MDIMHLRTVTEESCDFFRYPFHFLLLTGENQPTFLSG